MEQEGGGMSREDLAHVLAEAAMQKAGYQLSDLYNQWPNELRVFVLVVMQSMTNSLKEFLSEKDRQLFDHILSHTEAIVLPSVMDPRKRGGGVDHG